MSFSRADAEALRDAIQELLWYARHQPTTLAERRQVGDAWQTVERLTAVAIAVPGQDAKVWTFRFRQAAWIAYCYAVAPSGIRPTKALKCIAACQDTLRVIPTTDGIDLNVQSSPSPSAVATQPPAGAGQNRKEPSKDAIACYRLSLVNGGSQNDLAGILSRQLGRPVSQPQVSRWLKQVTAWCRAGNVLPDLAANSGAKPKIVAMDPALIDQNVGREKSTRHRSGDAELQRLIAEQRGEDDYEFEPIPDDD